MHWKIKATLQKILSASNLGDKINHMSVLTNKKYHENVFIYQFYECLRKFNCSELMLKKDAIALEIGTGYSIISPILLSLLGFHKVITVDITEDVSFPTFKKQIKFLNQKKYIVLLSQNSFYSRVIIEEKIEKISIITNLYEVFQYLNITYIAPYTFEKIEQYATKFDYISSQVVLEHIEPEVLDILFEKTNSWLTSAGICVHTVNFIDHFANPGIFQDKSISEFNFLKYSDKFWNFWSGNAIAYTNRLSHVYYFEKCQIHNLEIVNFIGENYRPRIELKTNLIHKDIILKYGGNVELEELTRYQRGTFVIKKSC